MNISKHAKMRSQQRGFSEEDIWLLLTLGEPTEKPGNAMEYKIGKRYKEILVSKFNKFIQRLENITNKAVLVHGDQIITVYNLR